MSLIQRCFHFKCNQSFSLLPHILRRNVHSEPVDLNFLRHTLNELAAKNIDTATAIENLEPLIKTDFVSNFAKVDNSRSRRTGFPEIVFAEGKSSEQLKHILEAMIFRKNTEFDSKDLNHFPIVASRVCTDKWSYIEEIDGLQYYREARLAVYRGSAPQKPKENLGTVSVLCAGTSDVPVAEECAVLLELCNVKVERIYDVGVAGIHRLMAALPRVQTSQCAICIAGMDGAMPSVVAGLVPCPVIAVPTSVGYGAAFGGIAPLLTMLNACAPGVAVVNIDNGFGAAAMAVKILNMKKI